MKNEDCQMCSLRKGCHQVVVGIGNSSKIMVVGECPTKDDDFLGELFTSKEGYYFKKLLFKNGINYSNAYFTYAIKCLGKHNKKHRDICQYWLKKEICENKPRYMLSLGLIPTEVLLEKKIILKYVIGKFCKKIYNDIETIVIPWYNINKLYLGGNNIVQETIKLLGKIKTS